LKAQPLHSNVLLQGWCPRRDFAPKALQQQLPVTQHRAVGTKLGLNLGLNPELFREFSGKGIARNLARLNLTPGELPFECRCAACAPLRGKDMIATLDHRSNDV
jgi:hypothetical protein